tara:strand:+ start:35 stop:163 length:129 start_codon:yes stop_codon:yes gene_type:complete
VAGNKTLHKRVSEKVRKLIRKEGKPQKQAVAMAYNMVGKGKK